MCNCYILFSVLRNIYYTGSTEQAVEKRLQLHLNGYYGHTKFTATAKDWEVFLIIPCKSISEARKIESHIKRMKSRKYIEDLKKYPEMVNWLKQLYKQKG